MSARRVALGLGAALIAASVLVAMAAAAAPPKANPCLQVKNCKPTAGPWVAVPPSGEADFLLECPKRSGTIGGIDVLSTSADVRVVWEANPGSPVRPGTSTGFFAFFRATAAHGKPALFQPYIGCIPAQKVKPRATVSARVTITRPGNPLDRHQSTLNLKAGTSQTASEGCGKGEKVISGWYAVAFGSDSPPDPALASKVHVTVSVVGDKVQASVQTDAGMPRASQAEVQIGALCST